MLSLPSSVRIYLLLGPTDMRKGFDGLSGLVRASGLDLFSGHLFVFISRRANRAKILTWERGGFVLWYKRLEQGRFRVPAPDDDSGRLHLAPDQLTLLLEGIDLSSVRRPKRWGPRRIDVGSEL